MQDLQQWLLWGFGSGSNFDRFIFRVRMGEAEAMGVAPARRQQGLHYARFASCEIVLEQLT